MNTGAKKNRLKIRKTEHEILWRSIYNVFVLAAFCLTVVRLSRTTTPAEAFLFGSVEFVIGRAIYHVIKYYFPLRTQDNKKGGTTSFLRD